MHSTNVSNCYNEGTLTIGDLMADYGIDVLDLPTSWSSGDVGGIVFSSGWPESSHRILLEGAKSCVHDCYNSGDLQSLGPVCGIFGLWNFRYLQGSTYRCFNKGALTSQENDCMGIGSALDIYDCYNSGMLTGKNTFGIGGPDDYNGVVVNCYNVGTLEGESVGGSAPITIIATIIW